MLAVSFNKILLRRIEYETCFEMVMDMLLVPLEERPAIFEDIVVAAASNGIPYHKLSPLNQFMLTIPGYVFYCLKSELHHNKDLFNEAVILMRHPSFPRYLQEAIGVQISQEIKGALWIPNIRGYFMTLILSALVFVVGYFLFGWSWWLSLLMAGGFLVLERARKKHLKVYRIIGKSFNITYLVGAPILIVAGNDALADGSLLVGISLTLFAVTLAVYGSYQVWVKPKNRSKLWLLFPAVLPGIGYIPLAILKRRSLLIDSFTKKEKKDKEDPFANISTEDLLAEKEKHKSNESVVKIINDVLEARTKETKEI